MAQRPGLLRRRVAERLAGLLGVGGPCGPRARASASTLARGRSRTRACRRGSPSAGRAPACRAPLRQLQARQLLAHHDADGVERLLVLGGRSCSSRRGLRLFLLQAPVRQTPAISRAHAQLRFMLGSTRLSARHAPGAEWAAGRTPDAIRARAARQTPTGIQSRARGGVSWHGRGVRQALGRSSRGWRSARPALHGPRPQAPPRPAASSARCRADARPAAVVFVPGLLGSQLLRPDGSRGLAQPRQRARPPRPHAAAPAAVREQRATSWSPAA